jgi:ankyrin repeat protein
LPALRKLLRDPSQGQLHARGPNQATPLHFAANEQVARTLLEAGADLAARDRHGNTPVRWLAWYPERRSTARFLLAKSGEPPDVFVASALGAADTVRELVGRNRELLEAKTTPYDAVARLSRGATPLHVAAMHGQIEVMTVLLDRGAAIDGLCVDGTTPLHQAAGAGHLAAVELLLARGARIDVVEPGHGSTPLGWAEFHDRARIAALLRGRGATC